MQTTTGDTLGSGFLIDPLRVITAEHVVREISDVEIHWLASNEVRGGKVARRDEAHDLALIRLDRPFFGRVLDMADDVIGKFDSFGYRHSGDFGGLFASGDILGEISKGDEHQPFRVLQLRSSTIDRGMSGAPIIVRRDGDDLVAGVVTAVWASRTLRDADLAFAVPPRFVRSLYFEPADVPEMSELNSRVLRAVTFLVGDRYEDGAWGKSFRPVEGAFSEDARAGALHGGKRALSVTAWAGSSLLPLADRYSRNYVRQSLPFIMSSYIEKRGAFGHIHTTVSSTPFVEPTQHQIPNPRHTASSAQLILELDGPSTVVGRAVQFLVSASDSHGGWGEGPDLDANTLSTAYVCNFLGSCADHPSGFRSIFTPGEYAGMLDMLEQAVEDGLDWLRRRQQPDGTWTYRRDEQGSELSPAYTAHVVAFAPGVLTRSDSAKRRFMAFIEEQISRVGGVPDRRGGPASAARTLMVAYGLARSGDAQLIELGDVLGELGVRALNAVTTIDSVATIANIFYLLFISVAKPSHLSDDLRGLTAQILRGMYLSSATPDHLRPDKFQWLSTFEAGSTDGR